MGSGGAMALLCVLALHGVGCGAERARYLGAPLGPLSQLHHGVRGRVFAVDARTLYIDDFHYDGEGPAAYFYVGNSKTPSAEGGVRLRDERGGAGPLRRYRGEGLALSVPEGRSLRDVRWLAVWCDEYSVNFGDVSIPSGLEYPRPARLAALQGVHGVSSDPVVVVDAQTLLVPNFSYDGEAPDAKFWVGRGERPSPQGVRIADENGKEGPLRKYDRKTIVLTLPGELTVFDIGHFGVWCEAFTVDFGHVQLPAARLANVPPSLHMLRVSPQSKLNCEVLLEELAFEVRWALAGDSIVIQLVARLEEGEYMSFGVSGAEGKSQMVGGDAAVCWVEPRTLRGFAVDYYLDAKSQCAGVHGSCPDERLGEKTNSLRLLNAALVNGYSIVTYQRSLRAADQLDRPVLGNISQPIIWAIGPLNGKGEVSYHSHFLKSDKFIEFGRPPAWNCPLPETDEQSAGGQQPLNATDVTPVELKPHAVPTPAPAPRVAPWEIPPIACYEPADGVFYAQMGPTGGKQGYPAITGHVGWGISWYINGLLIPEVYVVRGRRYTFVVEGGADPATPARYHPFYLTDDPVGGYLHRTPEEKKGINIYAGVRRTRSGELIPTGVGRLCNWTPDPEGPDADQFQSFGAYQRSLTLVCEEGSPGIVTWTPDKNTPDTVYYQCFTHRHLGWKIHVVDECDEPEAEASQIVERQAAPDDDLLEGEESVQVPTRTKPDTNFILDQRKKYEKIINMKNNYNDFSNIEGDRNSGNEKYKPESNYQLNVNQEFNYELPSKAQITEVIEAVENLESQMKGEFVKDVTVPQNSFRDVIRDPFLPEQPITEDEEYFVEPGKIPSNYMLPPNQKPLTLQSVLRPHGPNKPMGIMRPPYRRPAPPEIKRRPIYQKGNGYPLSMPNPHGNLPPNTKKYSNNKHSNGRLPPNPNRLPVKNIPPHQMYSQMPQKPNQKSNGPMQTIIMGKPVPIPHQSQTLSLGKTDIIVNQVVKSQITLPGLNEPVAQHSSPQTYSAGQIILGKPMENPVPLDQQMIPTKQYPLRLPPTPQPEYHSTTVRVNEEIDSQSQNNMKSSDFIGESADTSMAPAVNTGFKPDSIVIESGFKPIIREPLMAGEDRIADYKGNNANRREDTDVEEDYEEAPQAISNHVFSSEKLTESFEPMFIPSPEDHILPTDDRTKEVFPSNHAKEDRPHPVYVKSESELNALFSKQNMEKEVSSDMVMESNRVSPQYLPPVNTKPHKEVSQKVEAEPTFTTYDGKVISGVSLSSVPELPKTSTKQYSSKVPSNPTFPQFRPFSGDVPPSISEILKSGEPLPILGVDQDFRTTRLKLVNSFQKAESKDTEELKTEASEKKEILEDQPEDGNKEILEDQPEDGEVYDDDDEYEDENSEESTSNRKRRDTKTTQFEAGSEIVELTPFNTENTIKSQVDFEQHTENLNIKNSSTLHNYLSLQSVILMLLLKLL